MFKFFFSSQIRAITRDLPLKSCIKIRSCQGIWVHLGRGGGGGLLFEATHQSSGKAPYGFGYPKTTVPLKQLYVFICENIVSVG